ncbi:MAG: anaerobic ribonucleoside-triphosphate reductase activating protein [Candidatus Helarchaeota archaeon]|nr:anaerobic ribonucleoside-triphosphate reductase activating protein [Candidatus Helarchaeota archaeon]
MEVLIGGIQESSTIDYPREFVSVIFFCQCPFRCPFCQNGSLVRMEDCTTVRVEAILEKLKSYQKFITGVCITGGEPTFQFDGLVALLKGTHRMGLLNKLDTNGFYPDRVEKLLNLKLLNYIALDIKGPFVPGIYAKMIGQPNLGDEAVRNTLATLKILKNSTVPFETRTTIVPDFNDSEQTIEQTAKNLKEFTKGPYILQQFRAMNGTLDKSFSKLPLTPYDRLTKLAKIAKNYIPDVRIRTIEAGEEKTE